MTFIITFFHEDLFTNKNTKYEIEVQDEKTTSRHIDKDGKLVATDVIQVFNEHGFEIALIDPITLREIEVKDRPPLALTAEIKIELDNPKDEPIDPKAETIELAAIPK